MQLALAGLIGLSHDTAALSGWRDRYRSTLQAAGYQVTPADGTHFIYVRTPAGLSDEQWVETLAREERVLAMPASMFHHEGYFRLALTPGPERLEAGLCGLEQAGSRWC